MFEQNGMVELDTQAQSTSVCLRYLRSGGKRFVATIGSTFIELTSAVSEADSNNSRLSLVVNDLLNILEIYLLPEIVVKSMALTRIKL
jgi:hypothetical protein